MSSIEQKIDQLRERICSSDFLQNKGLGNEVGIHIFNYPAKDELIVMAGIEKLKNDITLPCHIIEKDLYELLLALLEEKHVLDKIPPLEEKKDKAYILAQIEKIASAPIIASKLNYSPHETGKDVLFITGVGKVYPFVRAHQVLNALQKYFTDIPVVMFYPGTYNGQDLSLFDICEPNNYYRAFRMI